jgi:uncharacterized surface anchored protein
VQVVIDAAAKAITSDGSKAIPASTSWLSFPVAYHPNTYRRNRPEDAEPQYGKDTLAIRNTPQGEVEFVKTGKDGKEILSGAKFELRDANGKKLQEFETTDKPTKITGLDDGEYFLIETKPPKNHQGTDDVRKITVKNGKATRTKVNKNAVPTQ